MALSGIGNFNTWGADRNQLLEQIFALNFGGASEGLSSLQNSAPVAPTAPPQNLDAVHISCKHHHHHHHPVTRTRVS